MLKRRELLMCGVAAGFVAVSGNAMAMVPTVQNTFATLPTGLVGHGVDSLCDVLAGYISPHMVEVIYLLPEHFQRYIVFGEVPKLVENLMATEADWDYTDPALTVAELVRHQQVKVYPEGQPFQYPADYRDARRAWEDAVLQRCNMASIANGEEILCTVF